MYVCQVPMTSIEESNASFIQLEDDSTGLWMGCLTLELRCKCIPNLSLIMLSFPVLKERDAIGEGSSVFLLSSGALKGMLEENLYVVSEKDVCTH